MNSAQRSNFLVSARTNKRHHTCASSRAFQCFFCFVVGVKGGIAWCCMRVAAASSASLRGGPPAPPRLPCSLIAQA